MTVEEEKEPEDTGEFGKSLLANFKIMATYDTYKYKSGEVTLEFSFERGENNQQEKTEFLELLKKAEKELEDELNTKTQ